MDYIWLATRVYEGRIVYQRVFHEENKQKAKEELASKQGGRKPEDFTWEGLNWEEDENLVVTKELELNEELRLEKKKVN